MDCWALAHVRGRGLGGARGEADDARTYRPSMSFFFNILFLTRIQNILGGIILLQKYSAVGRRRAETLLSAGSEVIHLCRPVATRHACAVAAPQSGARRFGRLPAD